MKAQMQYYRFPLVHRRFSQLLIVFAALLLQFELVGS